MIEYLFLCYVAMEQMGVKPNTAARPPAPPPPPPPTPLLPPLPGSVEVRLANGVVCNVEVPDLNSVDFDWVAARAHEMVTGALYLTRLRRALHRRLLRSVIDSE